MRISTLPAALALAALCAAGASAHELEDNRATLVLRGGNHLSLTLYIALPEALHQALAPQRSFDEFILVFSAMKPEDFQRALLSAQAKFESSTRVTVAPGGELPLKNWVWPEARQVQAALQQRVMQAVAAPGAHSHPEPFEVRAEAAAGAAVSSLQVRFPPEFRKVLVVAFRPAQVWVESNALSPVIRF